MSNQYYTTAAVTVADLDAQYQVNRRAGDKAPEVVAGRGAENRVRLAVYVVAQLRRVYSD